MNSLEKNPQLVVNHIVAVPFSIDTYKYFVNQNMNNAHYSKPEDLQALISSFFDDSKRVLICEELVKNRKSFEIDTITKKIYELKTNVHKERNKLRNDNFKNYYTQEAWIAENARRNSQS